MFQFISNMFSKPRLQCGGEGICEVVVSGKVAGTIRYRKPTSDEKLDYIYQLQQGLGTEAHLKEIKDSGGNKAKKCHEILIRDLSVPLAEKIFIGSTGFTDKDNKPIDNLSPEIQFKMIAEYFSFALVDLVAYAYASRGVVKKKY